MTPEEARDFWHDEYKRLRLEHQSGNYAEPLVQMEINLKAWESLLNKIRMEADNELAMKYLSKSAEDTYVQGPHVVLIERGECED